MSFFKELFGLNDPVTEIQTFSDYITEEPLDVFYNNQKIGTIDKEVHIVDYTDTHDVMQTLPTTIYTIKYKQSDLDKLLDSYGVLNVTSYKVFNGSDIAIYTSQSPRHLPIKVELPIELSVNETDIKFSATHLIEISETTSNIIQYEISQDNLYDKLLDKFLDEQPLLEYLSVEETSMDDNKFTCVLSNSAKHEKAVYVNGKYYTNVNVNITVTNNTLHDADYPVKLLTELFSADDIYKYYTITNIKQDKQITANGSPVIDVTIELNYDTIDKTLSTIITTYTNFLEEQGYQIGDLKDSFLASYSEGYIKNSEIPGIQSTNETYFIDLYGAKRYDNPNDIWLLKKQYDENDGLELDTILDIAVEKLQNLNAVIENPYSFSSYSDNTMVDDNYVAAIELDSQNESDDKDNSEYNRTSSDFEDATESGSIIKSTDVTNETHTSELSESDIINDINSETDDTIEILSEKGKDSCQN